MNLFSSSFPPPSFPHPSQASPSPSAQPCGHQHLQHEAPLLQPPPLLSRNPTGLREAGTHHHQTASKDSMKKEKRVFFAKSEKYENCSPKYIAPLCSAPGIAKAFICPHSILCCPRATLAAGQPGPVPPHHRPAGLWVPAWKGAGRSIALAKYEVREMPQVQHRDHGTPQLWSCHVSSLM